LPMQFSQSQRIHLEGDFSRYFALYAPDTYAITALTILAPDVMEIVMRYAGLCDIEIIDDKVYFYWPGVEVSVKSFENKFGTVQAVLAETYTKLSTSDVFAQQSQKRILAQPGKGVRLRVFSREPLIAAIVLLYFILKTIPIFFPNIPDASSGIIIAIIGWLGWKLYRRYQLKIMLRNRFQDRS
jgi:hypothetical protein